MNEQELIQKIQVLKQIKPKEEWVFLTKQKVLSTAVEARKESWFEEFVSVLSFVIKKPVFKPALASFAVLAVLFGTVSFSRSAVPGDLLYSVRKIAEKGRTLLASDQDMSKIKLEMANNRLEDLTKIAEANQGRNLAPAIEEFKQNAAEAAQNIASKITKNSPKAVKEIAKEVKVLEENKAKVEKLGVVIGQTEELDNALEGLVSREIQDLKSKTLAEEQQSILAAAEKDFADKNYSDALIKIATISND